VPRASLPRPLARALALFAALAAGCGERPAPPAGPPDATYRVRGEIVRPPRPGSDEILIRHESIPGLADSEGQAVGMASMTMPFALGPGVDRAALAAGRRIEFTLEVRWDSDRPVTATGIAPLPPGTRLEFDPPSGESGAAQEPAAPSPPASPR
jgi:hypothetical protein